MKGCVYVIFKYSSILYEKHEYQQTLIFTQSPETNSSRLYNVESCKFYHCQAHVTDSKCILPFLKCYILCLHFKIPRPIQGSDLHQVMQPGWPILGRGRCLERQAMAWWPTGSHTVVVTASSSLQLAEGSVSWRVKDNKIQNNMHFIGRNPFLIN